MALDPALEDAIQKAVDESGQPKAVVARLQAWLKALSDGEDQPEHMAQRYEQLLQTLQPGTSDED